MSGSSQETSLTLGKLSFHIFKRVSGDSQVPLYTVGVWEGTIQRAICHDGCLTCALVAIRREIEKSEQSEAHHQISDPHDSTKPTWFVEYQTTVHAVSEDEALHLGEHDVARGNCMAKATRS